MIETFILLESLKTQNLKLFLDLCKIKGKIKY